MENDTYLYPYSASEARDLGQLAEWRESLRANVACAADMRACIAEHYHNNRLDPTCVDEMLEKYGFKRVNFVLANTIQRMNYDGRFSNENKAWAKQFAIPDFDEHRCQYACNAHPGLVNLFANGAREAYRELKLFDTEHCEVNDNDQDYEGKVIVLSAKALREDCWSQGNQLWLCTGGFGSHPNARGRAVFATCLSDGETARFNRSDFSGVLKDEFMPDWAREKLTELEEQPQEMGGMSM